VTPRAVYPGLLRSATASTLGTVTPDEIDAIVARYRALVASAVPAAATELSGSTLLGVFGGHDIDLVVLVEDVAAAARRLRTALPPLYEDEWREDWAAFRDPGPPQVDVVLTTAGSAGDAHHRRAWQLLLADDALRAEYLHLRAAGMTGDEKRAFFDRLVARLAAERDPSESDSRLTHGSATQT
jgi:hypothetical protein